jgi:hypothetical protein
MCEKAYLARTLAVMGCGKTEEAFGKKGTDFAHGIKQEKPNASTTRRGLSLASEIINRILGAASFQSRLGHLRAP